MTGDDATLPLILTRHVSSDALTLDLDGGARACRALSVTFSAPATVGELDVIGSGAAERVDWPRIVVSSALEHFGTRAWLGGFVTRPPTRQGAVRIEVAGAPTDGLSGDFGQLIERAGDADAAWPVTISAKLPDGATQLRHLMLTKNGRSQASPTAAVASGGAGPAGSSQSRFGVEGDVVVVRAATGAATHVRLGSLVGVDIPAGALAKPTNITLRHIGETVVPPLDPGMINVTAPAGHGYEFLPHGQRFARAVESSDIPCLWVRAAG